MKLTLRTLLAFLDGTIDEDDAASLRKKIRESDVIRELIQRIRHVVAQPQLPAPKTSPKGMVGDPNTSSEYIDSTLDLERVAEFEKMTIGSDMLLAEVAEAHQILANLSEIDEGVSGRLRNRLYKTTESIYKSEIEEPEMFPVVEDHASIHEEYDDVDVAKKKIKTDFVLAPPRIEPNVDDPSAGFGDNPTKEPPVELVVDNNPDNEFDSDLVEPELVEPKPKPAKIVSAAPPAVGVKERKSVSGPKPVKAAVAETPRAKLLPVILATACVTALLVLLVVSFMYRPNNQVADNSENTNRTVVQNDGDEKAPGQSNAKKNDTEPSEDGDANNEPSDTGEENIEPENNAPENNDPENNRNEENDSNINRDNGAGTAKDATPGNTGQTKGPDAGSADKKATEEKEEVLNLFRDKDYGDGKKAKAGKSDAEKSGMKKPGEAGKSKMPAKEKKPSRMIDTRELMAEAAKLTNGDPAGVLKTALQPTLRKTNLPKAQWINLAQEQNFYVNDTIVSLPECQADLEILGSVRVRLFGFSRIELKANEGEVLPRVVVQNGMAAFNNLKDPNNTIDVSVSGKNIQVTFVDKNSRFAVVRHEIMDAKGGNEVVQLAALSGRILCKFDGKVESLDPNKLLNFQGDSFENIAFKSAPSAMSSRPSTLTKSAKESFFALGLDNPLFSIAAKKAESDSRPYVRKFATISNLALGNFDGFIQFMDDEQNRSFWRDAFLFARQQALTDASFRAGLKEFCFNTGVAAGDSDGRVWKNPDNGKTLFAFLTVTSDELLENGLETELVDGLQSDQLWMRAASIQSLFALTGKTKFFRAEDREEKRRKWVKAWEKSMEAGEIRISTPFAVQQFE